MKFLIFIFSILIIAPMFIFEKVEHLIENYQTTQGSIIYDCKGKEIDKIYKNNRDICSFADLPEDVAKIFICIEDKNFLKHRGFDFLRIVKASLVNILTMSKTQGASTITQQLVKNSFLDNKKTFKRKIKEAFLTLEIERKYTKNEIFEKYINEIYFGKGIYGIKTASKYFFRKDLNKLSLNEIVALAAIINMPNGSRENLNLRKKYILKKLFDNKIINENDYNNNLNKDITFVKNYYINKIPSFVDIVVDKLSNLFTIKQIKEGGFKIYTTLDLDYQNNAQKSIDEYQFLQDNPELEVAMISINPFTGDVKSIIGGKKFLSGYYNRAIRMKRQLGSSFKPIVFLGAIIEDYPLNMIIEDSYVKFDKWVPNNYDMNFFGNITMMDGQSFSRNIVAIKLLKKIGLNKIIKLTSKMGISSYVPKNLTISLGTFSCSAIEICSAYSCIVNGGYSVNPNFIIKVEDQYGNVIYQSLNLNERLFDERSAALALHSLKSNLKSSKFNDGAIKTLNKGGKSGTTNNFKDAWFCAFTPDLVTSTFVGYDDNRTIGENAFGADIAGPIWKSYMEKLLNDGYQGGNFEFYDRLIKQKLLKLETLDSKTGLIDCYGKRFLIKKEKLPCEQNEKYKDGLEKIIKDSSKNF